MLSESGVLVRCIARGGHGSEAGTLAGPKGCELRISTAITLGIPDAHTHTNTCAEKAAGSHG